MVLLMVSQPKNRKGSMVIAAWVAIATKIYFQGCLTRRGDNWDDVYREGKT